MYDTDPHHHHHEVAASPRAEKGENGKGRPPIHDKEGRMTFSKRVAELFSTTEWCTEESNLFEELLCIHGTRFDEISRLMCGSKTASQLQTHFTSKWASVSEFVSQESQRRNTCHLCFETVDTKPKKGPKAAKDKLVVCGGCERAYHVVCLIPRPVSVTEPWYCSDECVNMSLLQCQLCGNAENDEHMLLCDSCDRGYHMFCLNPPLEAIPEGDWNCPQCLDPSFSKPSAQDAAKLLSDEASQICTHTAHQFITTLRSGGIPRAFKASNSSFLEPTPSVTLPNNGHSTNSRSNSAPAIFATTPDKLTKAEATNTETKITEPTEPTNQPPHLTEVKEEATEQIKQEVETEDTKTRDNKFEDTKMEDNNTEDTKTESINTDNTNTTKATSSEPFIPPPPPLPKMTRSRANSKPTPAPPTKPTPPQSPSTPRKSPSLTRTLSSPQSALKLFPKFAVSYPSTAA